jgi:hypothetical protein
MEETQATQLFLFVILHYMSLVSNVLVIMMRFSPAAPEGMKSFLKYLSKR